MLFLLFEKVVAGCDKAFPNSIRQFLRYGAYGFPFLLDAYQRVGCHFPIGAILEGFCFFAEGFLLFKVLVQDFLGSFVEITLVTEESITGCSESLENLVVDFLGGKADGFPLLLQLNHSGSHGVPLLV